MSATCNFVRRMSQLRSVTLAAWFYRAWPVGAPGPGRVVPTTSDFTM